MAELNRSIGLWRGTGAMLNIVLGAGLLTLPGLAAMTAGPGATTVWLACAAVAIPLLAVFAILGRAYPDSGGITAVMRRAFGDFAYVPATFLFLAAVAVGLPSIAIAGGHYAASAFGGPVHGYAGLLLLLAALANLMPGEALGRISSAVASAVVLVLLLMAMVGWLVVRPDLGSVALGAAELPQLPIFTVAFMMVFFAFTGWEVASNLSGEFRNPNRDLPLAIAISFVVAVALYLVLALIVAGAGASAAVEAPFAQIFGDAFGPLGRLAVSLVAVLLIFANLFAAIWAVSRLLFSAAREQLVFAHLGVLRSGIPANAVVLTATVLITMVVLASHEFFDLSGLLAAAGLNFLLLYGGASAALVVLATRLSHRVLAVVGIAVVVALLVLRGAEASYYPALVIVAGLIVAAIRAWVPRSWWVKQRKEVL